MSLRTIKQQTGECVHTVELNLVYAVQSHYIILILHVTTETWVLVFWPEEDSTTMVKEDHLCKGKGCPVGSDCVIGYLPDHKGKIAAIGILTTNMYMCV